jgi:hypothetical protein
MADKQEIDDVLRRLAAAPARFIGLLSRLEDADSVAPGPEGEWTPAEVVAHVRAANDIIEPRMFFILVRDNPPLLGYEEDRWLQLARYRSMPPLELLETMRAKRAELVYALRAIPAEDWDRTGTHEVRGPISVMDIARQVADHEDEHLDQIERAMGIYSGR